MRKLDFYKYFKYVNIFILIIILSTFSFVNISCSTKNYTLKNDIKKKIQFEISSGDNYFNSYQLDKALETYKKVLKKIYLINDLENEIIVNLKIAQIYILKGNYDSVNMQLKIIDEIINYCNKENVYFYYYQVYAQYEFSLKNLIKSLGYYEKCLKYIDNKKLIANIYNKIAKVYIEMKNFDEAENYLKKAIKINTSKKYFDGLGNNYYNLGRIQFYKKNYKLALFYLNKALENDRLNENVYGIFSDLNMIAEIYISSGEFEKAKFYLNESLKLAISTENKILIKIVKEKIEKIRNN